MVRLTLTSSTTSSLSVTAQSNYYNAKLFHFYIDGVKKFEAGAINNNGGYYYTQYTFSGLSEGRSYNISVHNYLGTKWVDSGSETFSTKANTSPPSTPSGLSTTTPYWNGSSYSVTFSWNSVSGATSYDVYKDGSTWYSSYSSTSITMSGLSSNTYYTFGVRAKNAYGNSSTNTIGRTMPTAPDTTDPTIRSFEVERKTTTSISVCWDVYDNGSGIKNLTLGIYSYNSGTWIEYKTSTNPMYYVTFTGLIPSAKYQLSCKVYDNANNYSEAYIKNVYTLSDNFEWDNQKVADGNWNLTASEWTIFQNKINERRNQRGLSNYSFTTAYKDSTDFTAWMFNQSITSINEIYAHRGIGSSIAPDIRGGVNKDDTCYAWYFNNIKTALNNA